MRVFVGSNGEWRDRTAIREPLMAFPIEDTTIIATRPNEWNDDIAAGVAREMGFACEVYRPKPADTIYHRGTLWNITMLYAFDAKPEQLVTFGSAHSPLVREAIKKAKRLGIPVTRM